MPHSRTWNVNTPDDADFISSGASEIRGLTNDFKERFFLDHNLQSSLDTTNYQADGYHKQLTLYKNTNPVIPSQAGVLYTRQGTVNTYEYDYLSSETQSVAVNKVVKIVSGHTMGGVFAHFYKRKNTVLASVLLSTINYLTADWEDVTFTTSAENNLFHNNNANNVQIVSGDALNITKEKISKIIDSSGNDLRSGDGYNFNLSQTINTASYTCSYRGLYILNIDSLFYGTGRIDNKSGTHFLGQCYVEIKLNGVILKTITVGANNLKTPVTMINNYFFSVFLNKEDIIIFSAISNFYVKAGYPGTSVSYKQHVENNLYKIG